MTPDVTVIGGGISGLSAAYTLMSLGHRVAVLERDTEVGGKARSERIGEFLMEHGPSSLVADGAGLPFASDLGLDAARVELGPGVRHRYLVAGCRLQGIAVRPAALMTSRFLSAAGRLRLLAEVLVPRGTGAVEETVGAFCRRRFGREFTDRIIDPLVCGMFAGVVDRLSIAETFPRLVQMERKHGSILRAAVLARLSGKRMPARRLFSWRDGVATLPTILAQRLGACIRTGVTVREIAPRRRGFLVRTADAGDVESDAVIVATHPRAAAELLDRLDGEAACAAARIEAPPLAVVFLGYARAQIGHALDGIGFLAPSGEHRQVNGTLFCSTMFEGRAPHGFASLAAYVGGNRAPQLAQLPADDLVALVRREFAELLGAKGDPVVARVRQWPRGLPQYHVGHRGLLTELDGLSSRRPGLFLTGNYFAGASVGACVAHASRTASFASAFLDRRICETAIARPAPTAAPDDSGVPPPAMAAL